MHIRLLGLFITLILSLPGISKAQSGYDIYHTQINAAERCMFVNDNYDSARFYFDKTLSSYDFCFLQDCVLAAQLALLHKDTASAFRYIAKGFENGLLPGHLLTLSYALGQNSRVTLFDTLLSDRHLYSRLKSCCDSLRPKYLSRINKEVRKRINEIYVYDQIAKAYANPKFMASQSHFPYPEDKFASPYDSLIKTVGYPGQKLIGVDDVGLAASLGMPEEEPIAIFRRSIVPIRP